MCRWRIALSATVCTSHLLLISPPGHKNCPTANCLGISVKGWSDRIRLAPAPRYRPGHPYYKYSSMGGSSCGIKERSELDAVLSEWSDIYGASPPADSRLLSHYMTPPPEPASVKLRRKANNDAGGAFRRWARRRRKIAPLPDSGGSVRAIGAAATAARSGVTRTPRATS